MSFEDRVKEVTKQVVVSFQPAFVQTMDRMRHRMAAMYRPSSTLVWNGTLYSGADAIGAFLNTLPMTKTTFDTFDVQPLVGLSPPSPHPLPCLCLSSPSTHTRPNSPSLGPQ